MNTYTAWGTNGIADILIGGEDPPRFGNGDLCDPEAKLIWTICADTREEAIEKYSKLQGWKKPGFSQK